MESMQGLELIEYRHGMLANGASPNSIRATIWRGSQIQAKIVESLHAECILDLEGIHGDKNAGEPMEYDHLKLKMAEKTVKITVFNRGVSLLFTRDEKIRRLHRFFGVLNECV